MLLLMIMFLVLYVKEKCLNVSQSVNFRKSKNYFNLKEIQIHTILHKQFKKSSEFTLKANF